MEVNVVTLENNKDYIIIDTIEFNDNKYLFLSNKDDENDMCVRKIITKDREYLTKLESENELEEVLNIFATKYKGEKNEE
ncbi:MAG: DUF1292 domain-containing protein [Bacilli bacterium]|nr:DUF1292 domain-containing protein [Bacilli bacterium]